MVVYSLVFFFFFFKQKTAYEVRISDWSSDVCSSDLRLDQRLVKRRSQAMGLTFRVVQRRAFGDGRLIKNAGEVHALRLPVRQGVAHVQTIDAAHHFSDGAKAELRHDLTKLFRDEEEIVDDIFGLAGKARAQHRVLRRNADRAGVRMTFAPHKR